MKETKRYSITFLSKQGYHTCLDAENKTEARRLAKEELPRGSRILSIREVDEEWIK